MKKVIISCISNNSLIGKYHFVIFDKYNNKVFDDYTNCGKVELYLEKDTYKLVIIPMNIYYFILSTSFIAINEINYLNFEFKRNDNSLKITAILVDKNYDNLPIERGKIKLWQNRIQ